MKQGSLVVSTNQQGNWGNSLPSPATLQPGDNQTGGVANNGYGYNNQMPYNASSFGAPPTFWLPSPSAQPVNGISANPNTGYSDFPNQQFNQVPKYQQQQQQIQNPQQQYAFPNQQIQQNTQPQQYQQPQQGLGTTANQGQF